MSETLNLKMKLLAIRKSIEYIQKTEKGNQGAYYADPAVLVKTIRDKMDEEKVLLIPSMKDSTVEPIAAPTKNNKDGVGFVYKSTMSYTWMDCESDDKIIVPWFCTAKHLTDPAMAGGSALTYFERYFLLKFFQIPTAKDDPEFFKNRTKEKEPPTYLEQMKWYAKHEPAVYKKTLEFWQIDSAKKITDPDTQDKVVQQIENELNYSR